jgi:hypothetical protein
VPKGLGPVTDGAHNNIDLLRDLCLDWLPLNYKRIQKLKQDDAGFQSKDLGVDLPKKIDGVPTEDLLRNRTIMTMCKVSVPVVGSIRNSVYEA